MDYFARLTAGLEDIAWQEIAARTGARLLRLGHRRIDFAYDGPPSALLALRCVDDVYAYVADLPGFDRARASLAAFAPLARIDFDGVLATIAAVRPLAVAPAYRVTASTLGKRNYSRYDIEDAVKAALEPTGWRFVPNRPDVETTEDLDLRVLVEDDRALVGVRLGDAPLHRRAYKQASTPGSLKAPVAYCLCLLTGVSPGDVVLDPTCGAGTILVEVAALTGGLVAGVDIDADAIAAAAQNSQAAGLPVVPVTQAELAARLTTGSASATEVLLYHGSAQTLALPPDCLDAIIANLPWGKQVLPDADLRDLYAAILRQTAAALRPGKHAVLLTDQVEVVAAVLPQSPALVVEQTLQISLYGSHPTIHVLHKRGV